MTDDSKSTGSVVGRLKDTGEVEVSPWDGDLEVGERPDGDWRCRSSLTVGVGFGCHERKKKEGM